MTIGIDMTTRNHGPDYSRVPSAADLIATLFQQLPENHPAHGTVRELKKLFARSTAEVREMVDQVPGAGLAKKAERIGISRQSLWSIWHGKYIPSPDVMALIIAAAEPIENNC
jgi:hypothetical protein